MKGGLMSSEGTGGDFDECRYLGGDPRLENTGPATVQIQHDSIRIEVKPADSGPDVLRIPKGSIERVYWEEQRLGMERAEYEEGVMIGPDEHLIRYLGVIVVTDPEDVQPQGISVRLAFPNAYWAKVFEKRCAEAFGLARPAGADLPF
jgi:hypothetical protein